MGIDYADIRKFITRPTSSGKTRQNTDRRSAQLLIATMTYRQLQQASPQKEPRRSCHNSTENGERRRSRFQQMTIECANGSVNSANQLHFLEKVPGTEEIDYESS
jgi:hypothetical protein